MAGNEATSHTHKTHTHAQAHTVFTHVELSYGRLNIAGLIAVYIHLAISLLYHAISQILKHTSR